MNHSDTRPKRLSSAVSAFCTLAAAVLLASAPQAGAEAPEPAMERLVLADGDSSSKWHAAEATMEPDSKHARAGRAMHFHVDVDHFDGEPGYPIGWPRTYLPLPAEKRDWSRWDFLECWIYAETSRDDLPPNPLGLIVRSPDRQQSFHATLSKVQIGRWTHFRFPVAGMPNPGQNTAVQFFIAEADYAHGDVLDFWIDDLALLRYAEPTLLGIRPQRHVIYADAATLRVDVELTGLDEGETVEVDLALRRGEKVIASTTVTLPSGVSGVVLPLRQSEPGSYEVQANVARSGRVLAAPVRVVSSPWGNRSRGGADGLLHATRRGQPHFRGGIGESLGNNALCAAKIGTVPP